MNEIQKKYQDLCQIPSDINEHLPVLRKYAEECDTIVEMGVRWVVSTYAFLAGYPKKLISIDIQHPSKWTNELENVENIAREMNIDFEFKLEDTSKIKIDPSDFLFIDTWHAYSQLKKELELHSSKIKKYIAIHDTTSFEFKDETSYEEWGWIGNNMGLWPAIEEFLSSHPEWIIHERYINNNGLTILKRIQ